MATSGVRVHPSDDMGGRVFGTGGPSVSRLSASEMYQHMSSSTSSQSPVKSSSAFKSLTLGEAYWTDRRRKIGLARRTRSEPVNDDVFLKVREEMVKYVRDHFHQKECRLFIPIPEQVGNGKTCKAKSLKCHCGEVLSMHAGKRSRSTLNQFTNDTFVPSEFASVLRDPDKILEDKLPKTSNLWTPEKCLTSSPTNAFGKITFNVEQIGGKKPAKYVRLSAEDSVDDCMELMEKHWRIMEPEPPNLVISVVGGAKNFKLDGRMRETFSNGLIKAAKTTSAWLITSGFNMGVMKSVGQAVHEGQTFQWDNDRMTHVLRCIGIAPWGYVKGRHVLESQSGAGKFNAYYRTSTQIVHKQAVPLNPDYTHFIFVDDGYRIRYGGVAEFRSKFEKKISMHKSQGGLGIPVVLLLVEGGIDAIEDVSASMEQGIPVVICAGTGRAADILAYSYNHTTTTHNKERVISDYHQDKLARKIYAAYKTSMKPGHEKEELDKLLKKVLSCCKRDDLIIIFNMNKHEELDLSILSVLLKGQNNSDRENQLKLAMTWNRADIAQEEILREDIIWKEGSLENMLTQALVEDKLEFVKVLLMNGIIMKEYLTPVKLEILYNSMPKHSYLYMILRAFVNKEKFTVSDISNFLRSILDRYDDHISCQSPSKKRRRGSLAPDEPVPSRKSSWKRNTTDLDTDAEEDMTQFRKPYKQLMIWAVLMNRTLLAQLFWELGEEPITSALIVTRLCQVIDIKVPKYLSVLRQNFHEMKDLFEQLSVSVLDECHATDPNKAVMLVERKSPTWSDLTCLQIAVSAGDQTFVSSVACQKSINNVWKSGIISSWPRVFLGNFCPLYVLWCMDITQMGTVSLSRMQKLLTFYTAPLAKFSMFSTAYLGFLILFTYMLLVDYSETPSITEWILLLWVISFFASSVHAFLVFPSPTMFGTFRDFFGVVDRADFLNQVLFFCAFIARWHYPYDAKVAYCVNAIVFYFRLMKLYTANRILGPKIYMIHRMFGELLMFLMVLVVFMLAYGVASQGLLYRHRKYTSVVFKDIIYLPYWQLYGEIYLDEIETDEECTAALTTKLNGTLPDSLNDCRTFHWLVPILLGAYLLAGNVLLINLLIAIFSHVFNTVEKNAIEIWKFQMYFLVMEFQNRPLLFPPFSLIAHIGYLIRWLYRRVACRKRVKSQQFLRHHLEYLALFEKEMMANKMRAFKAEVMNSSDMKFMLLKTRLDELTRVIEDELIAEQYNMMPSFTAENTMFAELGLKTAEEEIEDDNGQNERDVSDIPSIEGKHHHEKEKRRHKKHRKEKYSEPTMHAIDEDNVKVNILTLKEETKPHHKKMKIISDEQNLSPNRDQIGSPSLSPTPPLFPHPAPPSLPQGEVEQASRSAERTSGVRLRKEWRRKDPDMTNESVSISQKRTHELRNPSLNVPHAFNLKQSTNMDTCLDSDEESIPLSIYAPRVSNLSVNNFQGKVVGHTEYSDSDVDSELSYVQSSRSTPMLRRHRSRRASQDNLQTRMERARDSYNSYSNKLL